MDLVILVVVIVVILAYYGFMRSVETAANMANDEIQHGADVHAVSIITRTARLSEKLSNADVVKASAVKAQIKAMREGMKAATALEEEAVK
jgi:short subunit fatty acids transporter